LELQRTPEASLDAATSTGLPPVAVIAGPPPFAVAAGPVPITGATATAVASPGTPELITKLDSIVTTTRNDQAALTVVATFATNELTAALVAAVEPSLLPRRANASIVAGSPNTMTTPPVATQAVEPTNDVLPFSHTVHAVEPSSFWYLPGWQVMHASTMRIWPVLLPYDPAEHGSHDVASDDAWNFPASQILHASPSLVCAVSSP
jgi:hypothetical protein